MRNIKKILSLILSFALVMALSLALFSCGDEKCTSHIDNNGDGICDNEGCGETVDEPGVNCVHTDADQDGVCDLCGVTDGLERTEYTVTVVDTNGDAVVGAVVAISRVSPQATSPDLTTDNEGKVKASFTKIDGVARIRATVKSVPTGYILPSGATTFDADATSATITVALENKIEHTIRLVDQNGNALNIAGATVLVCQNECQSPVETDENGVAKVSFEPVEGMYLKVKISNLSTLPALEGYQYFKVVDNDGYIHFDEGTTELVVVLVKR